jgi:Fe-S-cluster containining protein
VSKSTGIPSSSPIRRSCPEPEVEVEAGPFSAWLKGLQEALRGERDAEVPCGGCTACCRSSQFVHIGPDETDTLAHIPAELLFPAPRLPQGHVLLGYDERGHCPMLVDDKCSIYEHRPRTCRTYDCRVFPAAGLVADLAGEEDDKAEIAARAGRWRFSFPTAADRAQHDAVQAAAQRLLAESDAPITQLAVRAIEIHDEFGDVSA